MTRLLRVGAECDAPNVSALLGQLSDLTSDFALREGTYAIRITLVQPWYRRIRDWWRQRANGEAARG